MGYTKEEEEDFFRVMSGFIEYLPHFVGQIDRRIISVVVDDSYVIF